MNSPEYTTSAPVIGPLIMCSGLRVSAKPYHPRHRVAPSSRVVVARQSIDRSLESRLVSSRSPSRVVSSRRLLAHHFPHPSSIIHHHRASSRSRRLARVARVSRVARTASTNPQFATGPQKCVVFGPVGPSMKARIDMIAPSPSSPSLVALCHREVVSLSVSHQSPFVARARCARTARMETRGTGRASNGREITRWSACGDVAIGADRGCVVVEVRTARATNATRACMT